MRHDNGDNDVDRYCSGVIREVDEFVVYTFDHEEATDYQRMAFDEMEIAGNFKQGSNPLTPRQQEIIDDLTKPTSFLDRMIDAEVEATGNSPATATDSLVQQAGMEELMFGMPVEQFEKKFKKAKKHFKEKRAEFETKAKDALLEGAKIYLGEKHTAAYEKYKLQLNQSGLAGILYQVHTMQYALHAISARIKASGAHLSSRDIEAFTGLQRVMLDVQKFQFEYMQSIEASMKELKADLELLEHGRPATQSESENIFFFKGGKDFLKQLSELKNTMDNFVPTESKNKMLNPNAEIVDIAHEEATAEVGDAKGSKNPFKGYEGSQKRQRRTREDSEDGDDDDDLDI